jgi:hypothetical protein
MTGIMFPGKLPPLQPLPFPDLISIFVNSMFDRQPKQLVYATFESPASGNTSYPHQSLVIQAIRSGPLKHLDTNIRTRVFKPLGIPSVLSSTGHAGYQH